ncbi:MAG TPA: segregation/condensation protein A [Elusimicrobiota bacterium]|nr:segregation/condensation protein A [Elusimicrobiota bacterium]
MVLQQKNWDVNLDIFEGPLDLLLYLIQRNDLDIYDIPIAQITAEYLAYLDIIKELSLEVAGEFLVMASTLMQVKARMLLPAPSSEGNEGPDPRAELVNKLLEYQRYKEAAKELGKRLDLYKDVHYKGSPVFTEDDYTLDATMFDLIAAFKQVLSELKENVQEIIFQEIPVEVKIRDLLSFLETNPQVTFREIFSREKTRHGMIMCFLALLELIRLKQIVARQVEVFGEIRVLKATEEMFDTNQETLPLTDGQPSN